ncbi:oligosaccharide flippase family protein [Thomasclavelia spiroformis]|uniref:oligosaccharide flippase family protein n=1 Tax=Thomasclavelia spiroformis TaxID=29348 RepID=UPI0024B0DD6B|nr:oligosaccharide flippase family protein [Thomasclavelia spiroformis]
MKARINLLKNTVYLYLLTFSTQLLNLITIPYQTRILGPTIYGEIGFAVSLMAYVQLILDFGFILSATEYVAKNRSNKNKISEVFTVVTIYKIICGFALMFVVGWLFFVIKSLRGSFFVVMYYLIAYWINSLLPDYVYRGLESMKTITIRTLLVKIFFTIMTFIFLKKPSDYLVLPMFLIIGNLVSVLYSWYDIYKEYSVTFTKFTFYNFKNIIISSFPFFCSRIASTVYQATNMIILKYKYINSSIIGYYSSADKLVSLSKSFSSPIADSLYPYMIKNKDFKLIKKILILVMPIIIIAGFITFIYTEQICIFLFGIEFKNAANILRCLLPIMIIILPTYILCFPVLNPLNLSKYANYSNIFGAVIQLGILLVLLLTKNLNVYSLCIASSITEIAVFLYRLIIVLNRNRLLKGDEL